MFSFRRFFEYLPNLSNSYWYPFQLQNSSSSSVSCFTDPPSPSPSVPLFVTSTCVHSFILADTHLILSYLKEISPLIESNLKVFFFLILSLTASKKRQTNLLAINVQFCRILKSILMKRQKATWIENYPEYNLATGGHSNSASDAFCHRGRGKDGVGKCDTQGEFSTLDCFKQTLQEFTLMSHFAHCTMPKL